MRPTKITVFHSDNLYILHTQEVGVKIFSGLHAGITEFNVTLNKNIKKENSRSTKLKIRRMHFTLMWG